MYLPNEYLWILLCERRTLDALQAYERDRAVKLARSARPPWVVRWLGRLLQCLGRLLIALGQRLAEREPEPVYPSDLPGQVSAQ